MTRTIRTLTAAIIILGLALLAPFSSLRAGSSASAHSGRGTCEVSITVHGQVHEDQAAARFGLSTLIEFTAFEDGSVLILGAVPCEGN